MVRGGTPRGARAADAVGDTAEVVFLGELTGATGFKHTCRGSVLCKYVVVHGEHSTRAGVAPGAASDVAFGSVASSLCSDVCGAGVSGEAREVMATCCSLMCVFFDEKKRLQFKRTGVSPAHFWGHT